jgi:hypothetical protein
MKSRTVIPYDFAMKCELCQRQDTLHDFRLCQDCGDAIVRLMWIREWSCAEGLEETRRAWQANDAKVVARGFAPLAG